MIGNCICWAVIFKLIYGGEIRSVHLAGKCKTWYVVRPDGSTIMFKRTRYILPIPFREWIYIGKILTNSKISAQSAKTDGVPADGQSELTKKNLPVDQPTGESMP